MTPRIAGETFRIKWRREREGANVDDRSRLFVTTNLATSETFPIRCVIPVYSQTKIPPSALEKQPRRISAAEVIKDHAQVSGA